MYECKDCAHLNVCKYTDASDGRCPRPKQFLDKHQLMMEPRITPNARKALERMGRTTHGG